jgi:hypothetical protein
MKLVNHLSAKHNLQLLFTAGAIIAALHGAAQTASAEAITVPPVPGAIQAPSGTKAFLKGSAVGTQNYICLASGWTFLGPQATLFVTFDWLGTEVRWQIATHFLSPNPDESGMARPTWQSSVDTSAVWGKAIASSIDPAFVAPGAIAWLLLDVVGKQRGPAGGSILSQATAIQRVNTSGGLMPEGGCTVGSIAFVPYTADYYFYKPGR